MARIGREPVVYGLALLLAAVMVYRVQGYLRVYDVRAGDSAPQFELADDQGLGVSLDDYGGKVVLLNFWATWCMPCKIEMPWFVEFQRKYKDRGFSVVAVSLDDEGWEVVRPFVNELELNFPVVVGNDEMADEFGGVVALPTTFIIDKQGRITATHAGLISKSDYEEEIEQLLIEQLHQDDSRLVTQGAR